VPDPRESQQLVIGVPTAVELPGNEGSNGSAREVGGAHTVPDVAAGRRDSGATVEVD